MCECANITTNANGVVYLRTTRVTVTDETVDFALGFRRIPRVGYLTINIADAIPEGTTGTFPIRFTLNGQTKTLNYFGGTPVTAADVVGTGIITVFYNWFDGTLQLMSVLPTA